jgi:sugar lactone lactonase YvrE
MRLGHTLTGITILGLATGIGSLPQLSADTPPKPGTIVTVAGNGGGGYSGDGGPATKAEIGSAHGLAIDAAGNVYICQFALSVVRKISVDGTITTVAGTGTAGYSGDGGLATKAQLSFPHDVAVDGAGNLYIAEAGNNRVRKVGTDGIITTIVGTGAAGSSGDGGPATAAQVNSPAGLTVDRENNLYIAEFFGHRIRRVSPNGIITTVAGTGQAGYSGDNGPAIQAQLNSPEGMVIDAEGNLLFTDMLNNLVRKVSRDGMIRLVAGSGPAGIPAIGGFSGDGGPATKAELDTPHGITVDTAGNLYIADIFNHRIRKVSRDGIITTVAGSGPVGNNPGANELPYSGEGGPATAAHLIGPYRVAVDGAGNLLFCEDTFLENGPVSNERLLEVVGVAAPGLVAGLPFPKPKP